MKGITLILGIVSTAWAQGAFHVETYSRNYTFTNPYSQFKVPPSALVTPEKESVRLNSTPQKPHYHLIQSPVIESMVRNHIAQNKREPYVPGYRLLLYSSTNRAKIMEYKNQWETHFPDIETQIEFERPHFKLYAGKYYSLYDAQRQLALVQKLFPHAVAVPARLPKPTVTEEP
jgi:hypothetical protein